MSSLYSDSDRQVALNRAVAELAIQESKILREMGQGLFKAGAGDQMAKLPTVFALWEHVVAAILAFDQKEADHQLSVYGTTLTPPDVDPFSPKREAELMESVKGQLNRLASTLLSGEGKLAGLLKKMPGHVEAHRLAAETDAGVRIGLEYKERRGKFGLAVLRLHGQIQKQEIEEVEQKRRRRRERIERVNPYYLAVKQTFPVYGFMAHADPTERRKERLRRIMALGRALAEEGFPMPEHLVDNPPNPCWQAKELLRTAFQGDEAGVERILVAADEFSTFVAADFWSTVADELECMGLSAVVSWPMRSEIRHVTEQPSESQADDRAVLHQGKLAPARHSPDFRSVHWFGIDYTFTPNQAACVKALWEAWDNETPEVSQQTLQMRADCESSRIVDIFKNHPALGTMIAQGTTKGTYRLKKPT